MGKRHKLLAKIMAGRAITFDDAHTLLLALGFECRVRGSHYNYSHPVVDPLTFPRHGKELKAVYLKLLKETLDHAHFQND